MTFYPQKNGVNIQSAFINHVRLNHDPQTEFDYLVDDKCSSNISGQSDFPTLLMIFSTKSAFLSAGTFSHIFRMFQ